MPRGRKKASEPKQAIQPADLIPETGTDVPTLGIDIPVVRAVDAGGFKFPETVSHFLARTDKREEFIQGLAVAILLKAVEDKIFLRSPDAPKLAYDRAVELADLLGV